MNSVSENDLELLESYLDDELTGRELEALRQRLSSEPQLAVAIDELKSVHPHLPAKLCVPGPDAADPYHGLQRDLWRQLAQSRTWL